MKWHRIYSRARREVATREVITMRHFFENSRFISYGGYLKNMSSINYIFNAIMTAIITLLLASFIRIAYFVKIMEIEIILIIIIESKQF